MSDPEGATRRRTVEWEDPLPAFQRAASMTGLETITAVMAGEAPMPPIAVMMGFIPVECEEGRAVLAVEPAEYHANAAGVAHGGLASTLLDSAMWLALHTTLPAGAFCSTLQMSTSFVRAITMDTGRITAEGKALHRGKQAASAEGYMRDADGRLLAHATTMCQVFGV